MPRGTLDIEMAKKMTFVARWHNQGDKRIIIIPKEFHGPIEKMKNPLKVTVEDIIE